MIDTACATICSLLPYPLNESKPGLFPGNYHIKAAQRGTVALTIIPSNVYYLVNPDILADAKDIRYIKVPVPAMELAQSIIIDYASAMLGTDIPSAMPGLMAVPGDYREMHDFVMKYGNQIAETRTIQNRWFQNLVDIADEVWVKIKSPTAISDIQRFACEALQLEREWQRPVLPETQTKCPFCQNVINQGAIKCLSCGEILDREKYQQLIGAPALPTLSNQVASLGNVPIK